MRKAKLVLFLMAMSCLIFSMSAYAAPVVPDAADWTVDITLLEGGITSPAPTTSITNLAGEDGVLLEYDAATGGWIGTKSRQYDYTTTAAAGSSLKFYIDVNIDVFTGWHGNKFELHILKNGTEVQTLVSSTDVEPGVKLLVEDVLITLDPQDTWGVRVEAGNYDSGAGVSGDITITFVREHVDADGGGGGVCFITTVGSVND